MEKLKVVFAKDGAGSSWLGMYPPFGHLDLFLLRCHLVPFIDMAVTASQETP